jgi:hypothetical protein
LPRSSGHSPFPCAAVTYSSGQRATPPWNKSITGRAPFYFHFHLLSSTASTLFSIVAFQTFYYAPPPFLGYLLQPANNDLPTGIRFLVGSQQEAYNLSPPKACLKSSFFAEAAVSQPRCKKYSGNFFKTLRLPVLVFAFPDLDLLMLLTYLTSSRREEFRRASQDCCQEPEY